MSSSPNNKRSDLLLGGSAGVLLVTYAESLPDPTFRQAALYAAPIVSMAVGSAVAWLRGFGAREIMIRYKKWDLERVKKHVAAINDNPNHPQSFKNEAQENVRRLEMRILTLMIQDVDIAEDKNER